MLWATSQCYNQTFQAIWKKHILRIVFTVDLIECPLNLEKQNFLILKN